jgi:hypothetical protein
MPNISDRIGNQNVIRVLSNIGGSATHGGGAGNITNQNGSPQAGTANTGGGGGSGGHASSGNPGGATGRHTLLRRELLKV